MGYTSLAVPRPDALLEHKTTMNGDDYRANASSHLARPASPLHSESRTIEERHSPDSDRQSVGTEASTNSATTETLRRKRQLSQVAETLAPGRDRQLSINPTIPIESPSQICLCQPDPKVPRPRNAFILYRQHHQAKVVNENPGLANPEISKIIGDQWRKSTPEVKAHWKSLAEEEKLRHQRQYPDYRYQPKRGRNSIAAAAANLQAGQSSPRCQKCGGKSMATPTHAPSPSFRAPGTIALPESPMSHHYAQQQAVMMPPRTPYGIPGGNYMSMSPIYPSFIQRPMPTGHGLRQFERASPNEYPLSPEAKRRRYDSPNSDLYGSNARHISRPAIHSAGLQAGHPGNDRLPRPDFMKASPGFTVGPPPSGHRHSLSMQSNGGGPRQDSNLTLAPLKINKGSLNSPDPDSASAAARSVAAMVMSIKPLHKIRTLQRISLPLQNPNSQSVPFPVRGAVLSIEYGDDRAAGEMIANAIRDDLTRNGEHVTRAFEPPVLEHYGREAENDDVLKLMEHWHAVSKEIGKYVTTIPDSSDLDAEMLSPVSPKTITTKPETRRSKRKAGDTKRENDDGVESLTSPVDQLVRAASSPEPESASAHPIPVALVPNYQLTATDRAAYKVPITDEYSPLDHWRWVAALWRGTVGPDVVIAIRGPEDVDGIASSPVPQTAGGVNNTNSNNMMGGPGRPSGESMKKQNVEVRLEECRTVIVRIDRKGEVSEQVLRRVAFEVGEWVRGRKERDLR